MAWDTVKRLEFALLLTVVGHGLWFSLSQARRMENERAQNKVKPYQISRLIEAENLKLLGQSRPFKPWSQPTDSFNEGLWSNHKHFFVPATNVGDWMDFALPASPEGTYRLFVFLSRSGDYGIVRFLINGKKIGEPVNLWSMGLGVLPTGPISLGEHALKAGDVLRIEVAGRDPQNQAPHYQFGIDGIRLDPAAPSKK